MPYPRLLTINANGLDLDDCTINDLNPHTEPKLLCQSIGE